ncbi:MAG: hypothetical protein HYZ75_04245 [Elusimicrobia bacterium]|nr:hypothetical protein [Elusimicrobiota bacterium]
MSKARTKKTVPPSEPSLGLLLPVPAAALAAGLWLAFVAACYAKKRLFFASGDWLDMADLLARAPRLLAGVLARDLALLALLWAGAAGLGGVLRRALVGARPRGLETVLVDAGLGLGTLSLLLLCLGGAGVFTPAALRAVYWTAALGGTALLWREFRGQRPEETGREPLGLLGWTALAVVALAAALNVLAAAAPEVFYDSLVYHLSLPSLYLMRGAVIATPENIYAGLPLGVQLLYGLALAVSGEDLAGFLHAGFGMAAAAAVFACLRRLAGPRTAALATLLFYLCPLVDYASWACGVDLASAFYVAATLCVLTGTAGGMGPAALAGLLAGFAVGTKFNTLPAAGLLVLGHGWLGRRAGRPWRETAVMAAVAAAAASPWFVKNAFHYGNPFYPFLHGRLGTLRPADWKGFLEAAGSRDLGAALTTRQGFLDLVSLPLRCTLGDWPLGDWPGPVFIALLPFVLVARWRNDVAPDAWRLIAGTAAAGMAAWALASNLVRYVVPSLPLLAAAVALAVEKAAWPAGMKRAAWGAALVGSLLALQCVYRQGYGIGQWNFLRGPGTRAEYLSRQRVTYGLPPYPAAAWINANTPAGAKVLLVGESRGFHLERDFVAATVYDANPFWTAAAAASDDDELRRRLAGMGVTHLLVSVRGLYFRHDSPAVLPRETAGGVVVDRFVSRWLDKLWETREDGGEEPRWLTVYALRAEPAAGPGPLNSFGVVVDVLARQGL